MTEQQWMVCDDPREMYQSLTSDLKWIVDKVSWDLSSDVIRCVVGNPFQPIVLLCADDYEGRHFCYGTDERNPQCPRCKSIAVKGKRIQPLLTWNDGIIPKIAQKAHDEAVCETCRNWDGYHEWCPSCKGIGFTELDPNTLAMLADAVEEASDGQVPQALLLHLRGKEPCRWGGVVHAYCLHCNGIGERPNQRHWRGCRAVEMFRGAK